MSLRGTLTERFDWRRAGRVLGTVALLAVVLLFVSAAIPQLVGADESYVVLSDSMSPAIGAGSMVYVTDVPTDRIDEGDVITYRGPTSAEPVTHRVVEVVGSDGERQFRTKGDANEEVDQSLVSPEQVVGRVAFHVPLVGYVVSFAGTTTGIVVLVIVPAVLLMATELWDLVKAARSEGPDADPEEETG